MKKIRVALIDDHTLLREGLKRLLEETHDIEVAGEGASAADALRLARDPKLDVLLLDIALPGENGIQVLDMVKQARPEMKVLMLSAYAEQQYAVRALRMGAGGYLTKDSAAERLVRAIRTIAAGRKYVSESLTQQLAWELDTRRKATGIDGLSERELQLLRELGAGRSVGQIASHLHLSVKTVSTYRTRLLHKLKLTNNAELIRFAVENQLID